MNKIQIAERNRRGDTMLKIQKQEKEMLEFMKEVGYEVQYEHSMPNQSKNQPGFTVARIYDLFEMTKWRKGKHNISNKPKSMGESTSCCSHNDQFDRKKGRIIALARLMKKMKLTKAFRNRNIK